MSKLLVSGLIILCLGLLDTSSPDAWSVSTVQAKDKSKKRSSTSEAKRSDKKPLTEEQTIKQLVDKRQVEQARTRIANYLQNKPDAVEILYQKARLVMIEGGTRKADNILGWVYPELSSYNALSLLDRIHTIDPDFAKAYALRGDIEAVGGNYQKAQASFDRAGQLLPRPHWLPRNRAVLAALQNDFKKAARLLRPIIERAPGNHDPEWRRMYPAAWRLMDQLVERDPSLELVRPVRDGRVKRLFPSNFDAYIRSRAGTDRPLLLLMFYPGNRNCYTCSQAKVSLDILSERHGDKMDFAVVTGGLNFSELFEPRTYLRSKGYFTPSWQLYYKDPQGQMQFRDMVVIATDSTLAKTECLQKSADPDVCSQGTFGAHDESTAAWRQAREQYSSDQQYRKNLDTAWKSRKKHVSVPVRQLEKMRAKWPDSVRVRHDLIGYRFETDLVPADSVVGVQLDPAKDSPTQADFAWLNKQMIAPWPELAGMEAAFHAMQGRVKKAARLLRNAERDLHNYNWTQLTRGILAARAGRLDETMDHLKPVLMRRPDAFRGNRAAYRIAWSLARGVGLKDKRLDPAELVRDGVMQRVRARDLAGRLKALDSSDKPVFVYAASMDNYCGYCIRSRHVMDNFARTHADKFRFLYVSSEPFIDVTKIAVLNRRPRGAPWHAIVFKGETQYVLTGLLTTAHATKILDAYPKILAGALAGELREKGKASAMAKVDHALKTFAKSKGAKAAAIAIEDSRVVLGRSYGQYSWQVAMRNAMKRCNVRRHRQSIAGPCRLVEVGSTRVDGWSDDQIKALVADIDEPTSFELYVRKYQSRRGHRALALTTNASGYYQAYFAVSRKSLENARRQALSQCNQKARKAGKNKKSRNLPACQVYYENDKLVRPLPVVK